MSKCAWERMRRYLWLVLRTLVFILIPLLLVLLVEFGVLLIQTHTMWCGNVFCKTINNLRMDSSLAMYTLLLAFLGVLLGLVRHIANIKTLSARMVSALERDDLEKVKSLYDKYESLPLRFLWPSQRVEFYRRWAEDILPSVERFLEEEDLPHAIVEMSRSKLTYELLWLLKQLEGHGVGYGKQLNVGLLYRLASWPRRPLKNPCFGEKVTEPTTIYGCNLPNHTRYSMRSAAIFDRRALFQRSPRALHLLKPLDARGEAKHLERLELCKQPLLLRFIPSIELPIPMSLQTKVLRFYLYKREPWEKGEQPDKWAGRQARGDYHAEVAWYKAGIPRPPRAYMTYSTEETVLSLFPLQCIPFRAGETSVSKFSTSPSYPRNFLEHLQKKRHHVILGEPGSGRTWLAQVVEEELSKAGLRVHRCNLALGDGALAKNVIEATYYNEDTFLIISEAEELIKRGMSPGSVWMILAKTMWDERFFRKERLFIKLIVPKALEPFIRNSMSVIHAPIELIELKWSNEDLINLWRHRIGSCIQVARSFSSILDVLGGGPTPESFRLKRVWKSADGSRRLTKGVDEYLVTLASGSPKCLMALGRRFLGHIAYKRLQRGGESPGDPEREVYESLAMLLEAYYGLRAEPIPECQDVVGKVSGKKPDKAGGIV